ncbi:MAG: hypothetical protein DI629_02540 [Mesorhizobium amorphae]|nr:MAG: hypothetical protein DI629_02540 [Mesorhizobium amorphae]
MRAISNLLQVLPYHLPLTGYPYRGQPRGCPVCGAAGHRTLATVDRRLKRLHTVACSACGLAYTDPMPTEAELDAYYRGVYRLDYQMAGSAPSERHRRKRLAEGRKRQAALGGLLREGSRTLDMGAGSGEFVELMLDAGYDAHGFEPGALYSDAARGRIGERIRSATWQTADYGPEFDLVSAFHVLEHLPDPVGALRRMRSWLRPGGLVYVEVPNTAKQLALKGIGALHFAHVIGFNRANLCLAAAQAGLRPARIAAATRIVFEMTAQPEATGPLRAEGLALTDAATRAPFRAWVRHRAGWRA